MSFRFWYSRNAKNALEAMHTGGSYSTSYYEWIYGSKNFKATSGTEFKYLRANISATSSTSAIPYGAYIAFALTNFTGMYSGTTPVRKVCLDETTFDDDKYTYSGEVSGLTINMVHSTPNVVTFTITNGDATEKVFNALESALSGPYGADTLTTLGTSTQVLCFALISDAPITIPANSSYQINITIE